MSLGFHLLSVVELAITIKALVETVAIIGSVNFMLRLFWAALAIVLFRGLLQYAYTNCTEVAAKQVKVVSKLQQTNH